LKDELTVLIPTRNRSIYLDNLLLSLDNQTYPHRIKCVISDNNSTDETYKIVNKWKKSKKLSINYIKNEHDISPIENWKILVDIVETKYSKFIFDDDWIENNCIEKMIELIKTENSDIVISNFNSFLETNNKNSQIKKNYLNMPSKFLTSEDILDFFLFSGKKINVSPTGALYKTNLMKEAFYFSLLKESYCATLGIGNDLIMNFYSLFEGKKVYYTNESLVNCTAHEDSITVKTNDKLKYYCYLRSLILLIKNFSIDLNKKQMHVLNFKIFIYKFRAILSKELKNLINNDDFNFKLSISKIIMGFIYSFKNN
jgi:glycosyltransferase involved in cell wall biosynthesis